MTRFKFTMGIKNFELSTKLTLEQLSKEIETQHWLIIGNVLIHTDNIDFVKEIEDIQKEKNKIEETHEVKIIDNRKPLPNDLKNRVIICDTGN